MPSPSDNCITATRQILINGSYAPSLINFRGPLLQAFVDAGLDVHVSAPDIPVDMVQTLRAMGVIAHGSRFDGIRSTLGQAVFCTA